MARKPQVAKDEVVLVKGDDRRVTTSADEVVRLKFDGYQVEKAGAESVAAPTQAPKPKSENK